MPFSGFFPPAGRAIMAPFYEELAMNILLLDGGKSFGHSQGELNHSLHRLAKEVLGGLGHALKETVIDGGYDIAAEVEKWQWLDAVI